MVLSILIIIIIVEEALRNLQNSALTRSKKGTGLQKALITVKLHLGGWLTSCFATEHTYIESTEVESVLENVFAHLLVALQLVHPEIVASE